MRKITFIFSLITGSLYAQQNDDWINTTISNSLSSSFVFKQESGEKSVKILFNPVGIFRENGGDFLNLSNGGAIKYRSFSSDDSAFRLLVGFQYSSLSIELHKNQVNEN